MTTRDYVRVLRDQWLVVTVIALVGVAIGLGVFLLRPAQYTATSSVYVSAQVGSDPQQAYLGAQLSAERVKSYTELVTGSRVTKESARRLGLAGDAARDLASRVSASSAVESVIISIAATEPTPQQAAQVANTVADVLSDVVEDIERPAVPNGVAPVAARVVEPADPPFAPSSTGLVLSLVLGLIGGLAVGVGAAFARNALDTGVTTADDLARAARLPLLGGIAFDDSVPARPLAVHDKPTGPMAEGIRQLRTNLQFVDVDRPRKVVLVTSSVPAEGKSTTVANLAIALAAAGARVLVIEADLRRPTLSDMLGVERAVGLTRVLSGRVALRQAIQTWGGAVDILPSGPVPPNPSELMASARIRTLLAEVRDLYDMVLIDTPPLLPVTDAAAIAPAADGAVLVCRYRRTDESQVAAAAAALRAVSVEPIGAVLTMLPKGPLTRAVYGSYYDAAGTPPVQPEPATVGAPGPAAWTGLSPGMPPGQQPGGPNQLRSGPPGPPQPPPVRAGAGPQAVHAPWVPPAEQSQQPDGSEDAEPVGSPSSHDGR